MRAEEEAILREIKLEELQHNPVFQRMHGRQFLSKSKGRNRRRHYPIVVTLLQYNSDSQNKRWRSWSGEDRTDRGRIRWDDWGTEVYRSDDACGDRLREEFIRI